MAQRIKVDGNLFLTSHPGGIGFTAQGTINLIGAYIGGPVDCSDAALGGGSRDALTGEGMKVGFGVLLAAGSQPPVLSTCGARTSPPISYAATVRN
jgi:hypothetical protein